MSRFVLRRKTAAITTAIAVLGLSLVAPIGAAVSTSSAAPLCRDAPAHARVRAGASAGQDPNSVSAATARAMQRQLRARTRLLAERGVLARRADRSGPVRIRTAVHVITREDGSGGVTRKQVRAQMRVLNRGFAGSTSPTAADARVQFVLDRVDYTANDEWYDWELDLTTGIEGDAAIEAKRTLHRGGRGRLNIYVTGLGGVLLGYATFPQEGPVKLDGVVLLDESLPGGTAAPYNKGDTATHEVGHWLGLFHTFENGCERPGDLVADTPYQFDGDNIFFCNESDDTCPQPGADPVHNFMSYGDDPCLTEFTRGQTRRIRRSWFAYRAFPQGP